MINGASVRDLVKYVDDRGYLMEVLRNDDPEYTLFGQVYVSSCSPGLVKAWHAHRSQKDNICVIKGCIKLAMHDTRDWSDTCDQSQTIVTGELNSKLISIPQCVWHGYMALGNEPAIILNIPTLPYNKEKPDEMRIDPFNNDFGYDWSVKSR
jgi:dTDP-4-dehydrorhamnose 3,5-epimerase